jgi:hypothetical protein
MQMVDALARQFAERKALLNQFGKLLVALNAEIDAELKKGDYLLEDTAGDKVHGFRTAIEEFSVYIALIDNEAEGEGDLAGESNKLLWALEQLLKWRGAMPPDAVGFDVEQSAQLGADEPEVVGVFFRDVVGGLFVDGGPGITTVARDQLRDFLEEINLEPLCQTELGAFALARLDYSLAALDLEEEPRIYWVSNLTAEADLARLLARKVATPSWADLVAMYVNPALEPRGVHHSPVDIASAPKAVARVMKWLSKRPGAGELRVQAKGVWTLGFALDELSDETERGEVQQMIVGFNAAIDDGIEQVCMPISEWSPKQLLTAAAAVTASASEQYGIVAEYAGQSEKLRYMADSLVESGRTGVARLSGLASTLSALLTGYSESRLVQAGQKMAESVAMLSDLHADAERLDYLVRECFLRRLLGALREILEQLVKFIQSLKPVQVAREEVQRDLRVVSRQFTELAARAVRTCPWDVLTFLAEVIWNISDIGEAFKKVEPRVVAGRVAALRTGLDELPALLLTYDRGLVAAASAANAGVSGIRWKLAHLEEFYSFDGELAFLDDTSAIDRVEAEVPAFREVVRGTCEMIATIGEKNERDGGEPQRMIAEFQSVIDEIARFGPGQEPRVIADLRQIRQSLARAIVVLKGPVPRLVALEDFLSRFAETFIQPYVQVASAAIIDEEPFFEEMLTLLGQDAENPDSVSQGLAALEEFISGRQGEEWMARQMIAGPTGWLLQAAHKRKLENWRAFLRSAIGFYEGQTVSADAAFELFVQFRRLEKAASRDRLERSLIKAYEDTGRPLARTFADTLSYADRFVPASAASIFDELQAALKGCFRGHYPASEVEVEPALAYLRGVQPGASDGGLGVQIPIVGFPNAPTRTPSLFVAFSSGTPDESGPWNRRPYTPNRLEIERPLNFVKVPTSSLGFGTARCEATAPVLKLSLDRSDIARAMTSLARHRYRLRPPQVTLGGLLDDLPEEPWSLPPPAEFTPSATDAVFEEVRLSGRCESLEFDTVPKAVLARGAPPVASRLLENPDPANIRSLTLLLCALEEADLQRMESWAFKNFRSASRTFIQEFARSSAGIIARNEEITALPFLVDVLLVAIVQESVQDSSREPAGSRRILSTPERADALAAFARAAASAVAVNKPLCKPFGAFLSVLATYSDPVAFAETFGLVVRSLIANDSVSATARVIKVLSATHFVSEWSYDARAVGQPLSELLTFGRSEPHELPKLVRAFAGFARTARRRDSETLLELLPAWAGLLKPLNGVSETYAFLPIVALNYAEDTISAWFEGLVTAEARAVLGLVSALVDANLPRAFCELTTTAACNLLWHAHVPEELLVDCFALAVKLLGPQQSGENFELVFRALAHLLSEHAAEVFDRSPAIRVLVDASFELAGRRLGEARAGGIALLVHLYYANFLAVASVGAALEATLESVLEVPEGKKGTLEEAKRLVKGFCLSRFASQGSEALEKVELLLTTAEALAARTGDGRIELLKVVAQAVDPPALKARLFTEGADLLDRSGRYGDALREQLSAVSVIVDANGGAPKLDFAAMDSSLERPAVTLVKGWKKPAQTVAEACQAAAEIAERGGLADSAKVIRAQMAKWNLW